MENKQVEYSDFLPIWKEFLKDAQSVLNVQMVAHHFYNLGRDTAPRELSDEEIDEVALNNFEGVGRLIYMVQGNVKGDDFKQAIRSIARAILKKASEK